MSDDDEAIPEIVCPAGMSPKHGSDMGRAMLEHFHHRHNYPSTHLHHPVAKAFNTASEALATADFVCNRQRYDYVDQEYKVVVVVRWWHSYRAEFLFRRMMERVSTKMLPGRRLPDITVIRVPGSADWKGMLCEPLSWGLMLLRIATGKN